MHTHSIRSNHLQIQGVFALNDIEEAQLLCMIPRTAILSRRTTQLAKVLEAERLGGGLALTIAVMYEYSLGHNSQW
jgi:SET domain-containing protein 6